MSGPDRPDGTRPWATPPAGDQPVRPPGEHSGGPPSVQPEEPTVVLPGREEPTVVIPGKQEFARPGYSSRQQPDSSAYPPQYQPAAPQPSTVEYSQGGAPSQQYGGQPVYAQPPFVPQQGGFGQPGQYGQPDQYGNFGTGAPQRRSSRRSAVVLGGGIALLAVVVVAAVLVLGFWKPGFFITTKLDVSKAQAGVQQVLTDQIHGYGAKNVKDITCNNGQNPTVKKGDTFTCEASIDGTKRQVTVTFQDNSGSYEVGRPS